MTPVRWGFPVGDIDSYYGRRLEGEPHTLYPETSTNLVRNRYRDCKYYYNYYNQTSPTLGATKRNYEQLISMNVFARRHCVNAELTS